MIVYLTGGIGTGKSTVLRMFADLGAQTLAADEIVRALYAEPAMQIAVADALFEPLPLDRARIAEKVFTDPDALHRLESIVHPRVQRVVAEAERARSTGEPLVYEVPLPPDPRPGDGVIVVRAPLALRLERLAHRGMAAEDALARINAQANEAEYGKSADYTIVNQGDMTELAEAVRTIWEDLQNGASRV